MLKSKDIATILMVAVISGVISVFASKLIVPAAEKNQSVEVVEPITSDFTRPSRIYFNSNSVNPTQEIRIREDSNSDPFSGN